MTARFQSLPFTVKALLVSLLWLILWFSAPIAADSAGGLFTVPAVSEAVRFFIADVAKIFLLLYLMVYVLAWVRAGLSVERVRDALLTFGRFPGYVAGSVFGAVTPFCSCSSIPLFLGFTSAGIPLGITMAFLVTSPLINEVAVVVLWGLLGWKLTVLYIAAGLAAGIAGGLVIDLFKAERWLQPMVRAVIEGGAGTAGEAEKRTLTAADRHAFASAEVKAIVGRIWKWVLIGVALGAGLHGFVPEDWFARVMTGAWWNVPAAVAAGMPLYTNVTGIVPVMESLLAKGLPLGTTLAFAMSTVGASFPEFVMLRQVMTAKLLALFFVWLLICFTVIGWTLNFCEPFLL